MLGVGRFGPLGPRALAGGDEPADDGSQASSVGSRLAGSLLPHGDALALLAAVDGLGPITLERLLAAFGGPNQVLAAAAAPGGEGRLRALSRHPDEPDGVHLSAGIAAALAAVAHDPAPTLAAMRRAGVSPLALEDPAYPNRLRRIELPPRVLFVRGDPAALEAEVAVAVVGTRRPTDDGRRTAARVGSALVRAGAMVVSGLAVGIDGAAHAAAISAEGTTVAVIGGGHDRLFPRSHDRLADAIVAAGGAIVSEHAPGTQPTRGTFPRRNRVISGLADAVVVVEAGARSGALLTAAWALDQGRECFLVPGSIDAPQSAGCLAWLRDYAGAARIVAGVPQLLEDLGLPAAAAFGELEGGRPDARRRAPGTMAPTRPAPRRPSAAAIGLDLPPGEGALLAALGRGATTADELAAVTGLAIGAVLAGLTRLEDRGLATGAYGRYRTTDEVVDRVDRAARSHRAGSV